MTTEQCPEVSFLDDSDKIPALSNRWRKESSSYRRTWSFRKQYNMPIVEVALVISNTIPPKATQMANDSGEELPPHLRSPIRWGHKATVD